MRKIILAACLCITLSGCAGKNYYDKKIDRAEILSQQGKWEEAYRSIDFSCPEEDNLKIDDLVKKYPEIIGIGMTGLLARELDFLKKDCSSVSQQYFWHLKGLSENHRAAQKLPLILKDSKETLNKCAMDKKSGIEPKMIQMIESFAGNDYFSNEAKNFVAKNDEEDRKARTGVIINVQVSNTYRPNSTVGSNLGAAYGQAKYIDSSSFGNYSATSQLKSGIIGAIIGAVLLDQPAKTTFYITYFVKMPTGDINKIEQTSDSPTHIPEGVCVETNAGSGIKEVNQSECPKT